MDSMGLMKNKILRCRSIFTAGLEFAIKGFFKTYFSGINVLKYPSMGKCLVIKDLCDTALYLRYCKWYVGELLYASCHAQS